MGKEKTIEDLIKTYLTTRRLGGDKVFFFKQFQSGATPNGLPDIVCCINHRFVGIEMKQPSGELSETQRVIIQNIYSAGGIAIVCDDLDLFTRWYTEHYTQLSEPWFGGIFLLTKQKVVL